MSKRVVLLCMLLLSMAGTNVSAADGSASVAPGSLLAPLLPLTFPRDHGAHPQLPIEWWYFVGELVSEFNKTDGRWGYQIVFFRRQATPDSIGRTFFPQGWMPPTLFPAHYALTDLRRRNHIMTQELSRPLGGLAGADTTRLNVWGRYGAASMSGDTLSLRVEPPSSAEGRFPAIELTLEIKGPPILHGNDGWAPSGPAPGEGSYYYSLAHLKTSGQLVYTDDGARDTLKVRGRSWMDHQFMDETGPSLTSGWDWFGIMFGDGSALMAYLVRGDDEELTPYVFGTWVGPGDRPSSLGPDDLKLTPVDYWQSPHTGFTYPAGWRLRLPRLEMDLDVTIPVSDCEMDTRASTGTVYWEGPVEATGLRAGREIKGFGYAELVGYDR